MASSSKDVDIDNAVAGEQRPRLDPVPRNASMENDGDILSLTSPQETHSGHRQSRDSMRHGVGSPNRPQSRGRFVPPADYETPVKSSSVRSSRPLRFSSYDDARDDEYYHNGHNNYQYAPDRGGESFRDEGRHYSDRSSRRPSQRRPPQAYMNRQYNFSRDVPPSPESAMGGKTLLEDRYYEDYSSRYSRQQRPSYRGGMSSSNTNTRLRDEEMGYDSSGGGGQQQRFEWKDLTQEEKAEVFRLPFTHWMHSDFKNHFVSSLGEFVGTTLFLLIAFAGTEVANIQSQATNTGGTDSNSTTGATTGFDVAVLMYISVIFGFSLMVNVWVFFRISGGLFNPAVTLAMVMVRAITPKRAVWLFVAQMLGSMLASVIVRFLLPQSFNVKTTLSNGTSIIQGVFIEAILTAELVFTIFMLAMEKHRATFIAPVGIGLALFIAEMVGVQFTGGSLNPARSFGPCVITASFDAEHWIYWVGPFTGAIIAVVFYKFIKTLEYEMANPGADGDPLNDPTVNPEKFAEVKSNRP